FEEEQPLPRGPIQSHPPVPILALSPESIAPKVRHETEAAIIATQEQHNANPPVNNLPTELLTAILHIGVKDAPSTRRFLASVLLVCRRWNWVVLASPTLWTRFQLIVEGSDCLNSNCLKYLQRTVIQSGSLGLTLSLGLFQKEEDSDRPFYLELGRCMSRWQDVNFNLGWVADQFFAALPKLGNNTAPKLRNLSLCSYGTPQPYDIFDPHDPCPLEKLEISRTPVVWSTLNLKRLRYLSIDKPYRYPPSVPELLQIFERSPLLESLDLDDMELALESPNLSLPSEPVCLPRLSRFYITRIDATDTLIRMMRFPSCQRFYFEITGEPEAILHWFINIARAALIASPAVRLLLKSNFSYDKTMRIITEL
ncbi:hypothetical protein FRC01_014294, partial [Tulasnella sp. 417]